MLEHTFSCCFIKNFSQWNWNWELCDGVITKILFVFFRQFFPLFKIFQLIFPQYTKSLLKILFQLLLLIQYLQNIL